MGPDVATYLFTVINDPLLIKPVTEALDFRNIEN